MTAVSEIINFISHFKGSEHVFLNGCCYWFAQILHERFGLSIVYEPIDGHFMAMGIGRFLFDIRGDVTDIYKDSELYSLNWLEHREPVWYEHLMRDCRDFTDRIK